jgi:hypothetical protein
VAIKGASTVPAEKDARMLHCWRQSQESVNRTCRVGDSDNAATPSTRWVTPKRSLILVFGNEDGLAVMGHVGWLVVFRFQGVRGVEEGLRNGRGVAG